MPATASDYILMFWPFGLAWCRTVQYIIYVTAYVSIYTLVLMAGDRSAAVMCTLNVFYRRWTAAKYTLIHSYLHQIDTIESRRQ